MALVTFAVSASLASIYADKYSYTIDSNQVCLREDRRRSGDRGPGRGPRPWPCLRLSPHLTASF